VGFPEGAKHVRGQLLARAAATLVAIGKSVLAALQAALSFIVAEVTTLLTDAIQPLLSARATFAMAQDLAVDPTSSFNIWLELGSTLFLLWFTIAVVVEAAIILYQFFSLGLGSLTSIVVSLILGEGLILLMAAVQMFEGYSLASSMVTDCEAYSGNFLNQAPQASNWTAETDAFAYWESGWSLTYAGMELYFGEQAARADIMSFVFGALSLVMAWFAAAGGYYAMESAVISIVLAAVSLILEAYSLINPLSSETLKLMDVAIVGMDGAALYIDLTGVM
jgi:hypothetical protein